MIFNKKLKDLTLKIGSGATPKGGKDSYLSSGTISLIRSQNVYNHNFIKDGLVFISEQQAQKLNNVTLQENDILLNITGDSVARCCIVPKELLPSRVNQHVAIIRCDTQKLDPYYLLSVLTSPRMQQFLLSIATTGGTRAALTKGMIENLDIPYVPIHIQKTIGGILQSINSKIENNKALILNLEQLSQLLYKRWFIDYEFPDNQGLPYRSNGGKMIETEIGFIPEDWSIKKLDNFFKVKTGKRNANAATSDGKYAFFTCSKGEFVTNEFSYDGAAILVAGNGNFSVKRYFGKFDAYQRTYVLEPYKYIDFHFLYESMSHLLDRIVGGARGSVISFITKGMLENYTIIYPNETQVNNFHKIADSLFLQSTNIKHEINSLINLRDMLLPKLLSGDIDIPIESEELNLVQF